MYKKIKTHFLYFCLPVVLLCSCSQTEKAETITTTIAETTVHTSINTTLRTTLETTVAVTSPPKNLTEEQKQIQALLTETKQFLYDYVRGYEIQAHADYSKTITQEVTLSDGKSHDISLFEVVDGDVMTQTDLINKMKPIFNDGLASEILIELSEAHDYYFFDNNGKIYISSTVGGEGGLLGFDTAYISSVDEIGDDTLILNMTAFGSAERWGYNNDETKNFTVSLKRTEDGLKIDKFDWDARMYITYHYKPEDDIFT